MGVAVVAAAAVLGAPPAPAGEGNLKQFCKAAVAIDTAPEGPSERQLERYRDTAPPEIAEAGDAAVTQFLDEGEAAFEDRQDAGLRVRRSARGGREGDGRIHPPERG